MMTGPRWNSWRHLPRRQWPTMCSQSLGMASCPRASCGTTWGSRWGWTSKGPLLTTSRKHLAVLIQ
eukprot:8439649-Alexandrium_andersonii.AAC.1